MKSGFTLVEVAIVLVVIGLLMGLVYKGSDLMDSARRKDDINKVLKIKSAMAIYHTKFSTLAGDRGANIITNNNIYNDLIREGLLTAKDFELSRTNKYFHFTGCGEPGGAANGWDVSNIERGTNSFICVFENEATPASNIDSKSTLNKNLTYKDICFYESMIDNKDVRNGEGRSKISIHTTLGDYSCKGDLKATAEYLYRVF